MTAYLPIELQRNGSFGATLTFTDSDGAPLDLEDCTFVCQAKSAAGATPVIASATVEIEDVDAGEVTLTFNGADFSGVPGKFERVELAYDLVAVQDAVRMPLLRGPLILLPGVS